MASRNIFVIAVFTATACSAGASDPVFWQPASSGLFPVDIVGGAAGSSDTQGTGGGSDTQGAGGSDVGPGAGGTGDTQGTGGTNDTQGTGGTGDTQGTGGTDVGPGAGGSGDTQGTGGTGTSQGAGGTGDTQGAGGTGTAGTGTSQGAGGTGSGSILSTTGACLTISYSESDDGGQFGPRNVGAIWVSDGSGKFLRTLDVWANKRAHYLSAWLAASGGSKVDAVSSATSSSLGNKSTTWDCKDTSGNVVAAGNYVIHAEFTEDDGTGPNTSMSLSLEPGAPFDTQLGNDGYFTNRHLVHPP